MNPRILLIEDSPERIVTFRRWLEGTEFVLIEASSGGRARGILRKGMTDGIAGLCLDHDLNQQPVTPTDYLSTSGLMASIILSIPRTIVTISDAYYAAIECLSVGRRCQDRQRYDNEDSSSFKVGLRH